MKKTASPQLLEAAGVDAKAPGLDVREYINDMPDCLAAADLVISRSGAMTLTELEASRHRVGAHPVSQCGGKPSVSQRDGAFRARRRLW